MSLPPGTRIGQYEILSPIGAGGMGEVYRATDTHLKRAVAMKVLPDSVAGDADRLARFQREAEVLAALNHPNIAAIYGFADMTAGGRALVMELVDGEDLAVIIARGPMALAEALPLARQIAAALEAAHDAGIIHRDLKPANIKVRADGTVKVLDFGLAKAVDSASGSRADLSNSPTMTSPAMTGMGMILGTAAYMSPEQAKGRAVDRRADVWAFGVVLCEMLTGRRTFQGEDVSDLLVSVLRDTPNLHDLPADTPAPVRRLLRRCLEKDPRKRLRDIGDAGVELDEAMATPDLTDGLPVGAPASKRSRLSPLVIAGAALALVAAASGVTWWLKPTPVISRPVVRFALPLDEGVVFSNLNLPSVAISRDGRRVAYRLTGAGFVRDLDQPEAREVFRSPGSGVWFSPDGESLLYSNPSGLVRVPVNGGSAQQLTTTGAGGGGGAVWNDDGTIVFSAASGLYRIPETGGTPQLVGEENAKGEGAGWPQILPGGQFVLFTIFRGRSPSTAIAPVGGGAAEVVLPGVGAARYLETGHLVYGLDNRLVAVPFDLSRRVVTGTPVPVLENVATSGTSFWTQAVMSANGTVAYIPPTGTQTTLQLSWSDAHGAATPAVTVPRVYSDVRLSPDGRRVALHLWDEENDVWVADLVRGGMTRITFAPAEDETPVWSPDGRDLAYASERDGQARTLFRKRADGNAAAVEEKIWQSPDHFHVNDWSGDGTTMFVEVRRVATANDVIAIDVGSGKETPLLSSRFSERSARLSRDGKWLAYVSDESGRNEVYVQPYPALDTRVPVSTAGGTEPVWSHDGRQLLFRSAESVMMASVTSRAPIEFTAPKVLFADRYTRTQGLGHTHFDVAPDGRLLMSQAPAEGPSRGQRRHVNVVLNWFEELLRLAPIK